jgi:AraC-like DNA-binding protein
MATMCVLLTEIDLSAGLRPERASAGEVTYPPGGRLGPRWQRDVQLLVVHSGSARIVVDDAAPATCQAGSVALLLPGHTERFEFDARVETRHSWVQLGLADPPPEAITAAPPALGTSTALAELVREAAEVARSPLSTAEPLLAALAAAAIWRYVGEAGSRLRQKTRPVELARRFLHLQLSDPDVDLARAAQAAHVTPAHLVRRFKAELGVTPVAYLWERRVATGIDMLTNTGLSVGEIARRSGFKSVYHFSRRVKAQTGLAPTAIRRRDWSPASEEGDHARH